MFYSVIITSHHTFSLWDAFHVLKAVALSTSVLAPRQLVSLLAASVLQQLEMENASFPFHQIVVELDVTGCLEQQMTRTGCGP